MQYFHIHEERIMMRSLSTIYKMDLARARPAMLRFSSVWNRPKRMVCNISGWTHAALMRQAVQSSPKRSTPCTVGTKDPWCAMHILLMCHRMPPTLILGSKTLNSQEAGGLREDGLSRSLSLL